MLSSCGLQLRSDPFKTMCGRQSAATTVSGSLKIKMAVGGGWEQGTLENDARDCQGARRGEGGVTFAESWTRGHSVCGDSWCWVSFVLRHSFSRESKPIKGMTVEAREPRDRGWKVVGILGNPFSKARVLGSFLTGQQKKGARGGVGGGNGIYHGAALGCHPSMLLGAQQGLMR